MSKILEELKYNQEAIKSLKTDVTKLKFYKKSQFLIYEYGLLNKVAMYLELKNIPKSKVPLEKLKVDISVKMDKLKANPSVKLISEIFDNILVKDELRIDLKFLNRTKDDLILKDKESVSLVVKANRPSYYYIVGSTTDKLTGDITNYLMQLNHQKGNNKFIGTVGIDEIKKYVILAEFKIGKPFGFEHLHIFASDKKFKELPKYSENSLGLFEIKNKISKTINRTRALYLKKRKEDKKKILFAENSLDFETRR
jgi:hypothetical protein